MNISETHSGMPLAACTDMTFKKCLVIGSALAGAALLANKERRNRLFQSSKDFIDNARKKLEAKRAPVDIGTGVGANVTTASDYPSPPI